MDKSKSLQKLDELIPEFAEFKKLADTNKKVADRLNAEIKVIMDDLALQHYEVGEYNVTHTVQDRSTMDDDKMLALAHRFNVLNGCIKKKEYFDYDVLEKLIYDGQIPDSIMKEISAAKEEKFVGVLKLSKKKEKE